MLANLLVIGLTAILVENFILVKFLGVCPFLGVSRKSGTAIGMGLAVTIVMTLSSALVWLVYHFLLVPLKLEYLKIIAFILIISGLVQILEITLNRLMPKLYRALGIYLPLITTNCAILGMALLLVDKGYNFVEAIVFGLSAAIGFTLALVLFSSIIERLEFCDIPKAFKGFPITLVAAALLALAFMGFSGLKLPF